MIRAPVKAGCHKESQSPGVGFFHAWWQNLNFRFYRLPKLLVDDKEYRDLSIEAALLYSLLLDRAFLSVKHSGFRNEAGGVYVVFTNKEICQKLRCGHEKASHLLNELEKRKLIYVDRTHRKSRANQIYIQPFIRHNKEADNPEDASENQMATDFFSEKQLPANLKTGADEHRKTDVNDTDRNNTDTNDTEYFCDVWSEEEIRRRVKRWIGYETLSEKEKYRPYLDTAVQVMTEIFSNRQKTIRIGKETVSRRDVVSRLCQIDRKHMAFVLETAARKTGIIDNPGAFLLAQLYYAPVNIHRLRSDEILMDLKKEADREEVMA